MTVDDPTLTDLSAPAESGRTQAPSRASATAPTAGGTRASRATGADAGDPGPLPDDLVTRLLSARAYLSDGFADRVAAALIAPGRRALSPLWMVDALSLARHAAQAKRYRRVRDSRLVLLGGYLLGTGTLVLFATVAGWLALRSALLIWILLWVVAYLAAVRICHRQALAARRAGVAVLYEPQEVRPAPLARRSLEAALEDLNRANVVLFRGDSSPFVGSGVKVDSWSLTLDLSTRAAPAHNRAASAGPAYTARPARPDPITGGDLQEYLLATVPPRITPQPGAGHRLSVRGGSNALSVPLFRSGPLPAPLTEALGPGLDLRRPVSHVPDEVIAHHLHHRSEGTQVHTWFTHSAWGGQVVVTLYVHAYVSNHTLFVEGLVYALRPLAQEFYSVRGLPTDRRVESSALLREALTAAPRTVVGAPVRLFNAWRGTRSEIAAAAALEDEIEGRRDIDFGALPSIREEVADEQIADRFAAVDERMYYQIFNRRAIEGIGAFLDSRHVDLSEFSAQAAAIIAATTANARALYGPV